MRKVSLFRKLATLIVALFVALPMALADGGRMEHYLKGSTGTPAGDYVVQTSEDVFHFMGKEYEVYGVYYDDPSVNMKIAVNNEGKCTSFVAYNDECILFYNCNKHGFGVRKVMFSNPWVKDGFDSQQFHDQTVLMKSRKVEKKDAVGLIAAYVPQMKS